MSNRKKYLLLNPFFLLGVVLAVGSLVLCLTSLNAPVRMAKAPEDAVSCTAEFMEAVCRRDLAGAAGYLEGNTLLSSQDQSMPGYAQQLWDAYYGSISYEFEGECYADGKGLYRRVAVTALDISALMDPVKDRYHSVVEAAVQSAEDPSQVYGDGTEYLESFIMDALEETIAQVLKENAPTVTTSLTLSLRQERDQWKIQTDSQLIRFLSGGLG